MKRFLLFSTSALVLLLYFEFFGTFPPEIPPYNVAVIRLWRILLGLYVGSVLGITGVIIQTITANPLMDPYLSGVSSGAGFGAVVVMGLLGSGVLFTLMGPFAGGLVAFFTVYLLLKLVKNISGTAIVLTGISASFLYSSLTIITMILTRVSWGRIIFMLFGSINKPVSLQGFTVFLLFSLLSVPLFIYSILKWKDLNLLLLGDESSKAMGVNVERLKEIFLVIVAFLVSVSVSFAGMIGFIGIMAPHISRRMVGGDHRILIPASMFTGAIILLFSDIMARKLFIAQLPLTVISSLLGVPFFVYLLIKERRWLQ